MKRSVALVLLVLLAVTAVSGQEKFVLVGGGYIEHHHSYGYDGGTNAGSGLPTNDFEDRWRSWGLGSTQLVVGPKGVGFYGTTMLTFLEQLQRTGSSSEDFKDFRLGLGSINGVGGVFHLGPVSLLLGGGLHTDIVFASKYPGTTDSNYWFFNIGLGGGVHLAVPLNPNIGIHVGTAWWWDPFQIRTSSSSNINNNFSFDGGWGYNVTAGIVLHLVPPPETMEK